MRYFKAKVVIQNAREYGSLLMETGQDCDDFCIVGLVVKPNRTIRPLRAHLALTS